VPDLTLDEHTTFDFGQALRLLKQGFRVARKGWNGRAMWLALTPGSIITLDKARQGAAALLAQELLTTDALSSHPRPQDRSMVIGAHIDMRAADGSLVIGWLASQTDMLATDWLCLELADPSDFRGRCTTCSAIVLYSRDEGACNVGSEDEDVLMCGPHAAEYLADPRPMYWVSPSGEGSWLVCATLAEVAEAVNPDAVDLVDLTSLQTVSVADGQSDPVVVIGLDGAEYEAKVVVMTAGQIAAMPEFDGW
jgi:hypothetical protein